MTKRYDLVVCGSGPAGTSAALAAVRHGLSVALLERKKLPRQKLCAGLLTWKSMHLLERHFALTESDLAQSNALSCISNEYGIRTREGLLAQGRTAYPFHFIRRTHFDALLANRAVDEGVDFFQQCSVIDYDPVTRMLKTSQGPFQSTLVIGADGVSSLLRRSVLRGVAGRQQWKKNLAAAVEGVVDRNRWPEELLRPELYLGFIRAGYGWVFPNKDKIIVGMCGLKRKEYSFNACVDSFLHFLGIKGLLNGLRGHPLPYGNWLERPCSNSVLLAGDAAGIVEPLFGEGIFFAMASGRHAGIAAAQAMELGDPSKAGSAYLARLEDCILPELRGADAWRRRLFKSFDVVGSGGFGLFLKLLGRPLGDMVHGKRSYANLLTKHWDF